MSTQVIRYLRQAEEADNPQIVALMNVAFRGEGALRGWSTEAAYISGARTSLSLLLEEAIGGTRFFVADAPDGRGIDGCVGLKKLGREIYSLGSLAVQPRLQNSGLGRALLTEAETLARSEGSTAIEITVVNVRETLLSWYERRGYVRTGEVRPFPYLENRFGKPLRDDLAFVVLGKQLGRSTE
jgi:ribosomal protein S18 acetylase RimI-like enzyme